MTRRSASLLCIVVVGGAPVACDGGDSPDGEEPPRAALVRDCRTHVEGRLPPGWRREAVTAGPVALTGARAYRTAENPNPGARFVDLKTIVVVDAGEEATVAVAPKARRRASLDYAYGVRRQERSPPVKLSDGVPVVRFAACRPGTRPLVGGHPLNRETQFNGGIITRWHRCLPLDVWPRDGERPRRVTISFGAGECGR
jgi:hypothetical protein